MAQSPSSTLCLTSRGIQKDSVRNSSSGSRRVGRGWEGLIVSAHEDARDWIDLQNRGLSEWGQKLWKIACVIHCTMIRWVSSYQPWGPPNIYSPLPRSSPSSLYLRKPTVAQSSAKLTGSGGEKQISPPQWGAGVGQEVVQWIESQHWTYPSVIAQS